jgi:hypothetical protein
MIKNMSLMNLTPQYAAKMLDHVVQRLEIVLKYPENEIVKQGDIDCDNMYFIQKG